MEYVLVIAKFGKFKVQANTGSFFRGQKGTSDREGHGHKAVVYKRHFPPLRHSLIFYHSTL